MIRDEAERPRRVRVHLPLGEVREQWIPASVWRSGQMMIPWHRETRPVLRFAPDGLSESPAVTMLVARPLAGWVHDDGSEDWLAE